MRPQSPASPRVYSDRELAALDRRFAEAPAPEIVRWAVESFGSELVVAASMADAVLIDLAVKTDPSIDVVFIDTGRHFPETLATVAVVRARYDLNLRVIGPPPNDDARWALDTDGCCSTMKVGLFDLALEGKAAWMSGLRRVDSPTRADAPVVGRDSRGLVKINPLAGWTDTDVDRYIAEHDVPVNPLVLQGYLSIGCQPCTQPVAPGAHPRSGRWVGQAKTECGLHDRE